MLKEVLELLQELTPWSVLLRTALSLLFGGCIGLERGYHGRAAGLRTHILVCLGACMSAMIGLFAAWELGFSNDPLRVGAQVVSGLGWNHHCTKPLAGYGTYHCGGTLGNGLRWSCGWNWIL